MITHEKTTELASLTETRDRQRSEADRLASKVQPLLDEIDRLREEAMEAEQKAIQITQELVQNVKDAGREIKQFGLGKSVDDIRKEFNEATEEIPDIDRIRGQGQEMSEAVNSR